MHLSVGCEVCIACTLQVCSSLLQPYVTQSSMRPFLSECHQYVLILEVDRVLNIAEYHA